MENPNGSLAQIDANSLFNSTFFSMLYNEVSNCSKFNLFYFYLAFIAYMLLLYNTHYNFLSKDLILYHLARFCSVLEEP